MSGRPVLPGFVGALLLSGCGEVPRQAATNNAGLEAAAIERGLIHAPADVPLTGVFAGRKGRLCLMAQGRRIGVSTDNGADGHCAATGTFDRRGDGLAVMFGDCRFDAEYAGARIAFPGRLPDECTRLCDGTASFADLRVERLSDSASEATALRDHRERSLCEGDS